MLHTAQSRGRDFPVILRVTHALLIRELMIRYGRKNLGFLWLIAEPLLLTIGVMVVWIFIRSKAAHGISVAGFALTGYSMLMLWRHSVQIGIGCLQQSSGLMFHRDIAPLMVLLSRMFLESFGCLASFTLAYGALILVEVVEPANDYLFMVLGWLSLSVFGFGVAMLVAGLTEFSDAVGRLIQPAMYVTLPLTGVFALVAWLPQEVQGLYLYSPLVHMVEMFRYGFFGGGTRFHFDMGFVAISTLATLMTGAVTFAAAERRMRMR